MGYESKFYIVKPLQYEKEINGAKKQYAEVIATFDLCKDYAVSDHARRATPTNLYVFDGHGANGEEQEIVKDCYGAPLTEFTIDELIAWLIEAEAAERYWRRLPLIGLLQSIAPSMRGSFKVLHYGY